MYLAIYAKALLSQGRRLGVLCQDPDGLRARLSLPEEDPASVKFATIPALPAKRAGRKPGVYARWRWARTVSAAALQVERELGEGTAVAHLMCLYEHEARWPLALVKQLRRPWTGLYMHARAGLGAGAGTAGKPHVITRLLASDRLRGLLVLNEEALENHAHTGKWPVVLAPDLTDAAFEPEHPLAARVKRFAAGAPVAGVLGYLLPSKGVATMAELALRPDPSGPVFLFAGEAPLDRFTEAERTRIVQAMTRAPRALFHTSRLPTEADYNALLQSCDVVCAVYRDFPHSSNTLTKAAVFERPIIVSEGHLMARRVREYRLGEVVPQDDAAALLAAIHRITADPAGWRASVRPRWREYREAHSEARLGEALTDLFRGL